MHADAVELNETRVFELMGFKCSRCRRIKHPVCPYSTKALVYKIESKAPTLDMYEMDFNSLHSERLMEEEPGFSSIPMKEVGHVVADNAPIHSPSEAEECIDTPNIDCGRNYLIGLCSGPHKLPVRRHMKGENNVHYPLLPDPFQINISSPFEGNASNSTGKLPVRRHIKGENNSDNYSSVSLNDQTPSPSDVLDSQWDVSNWNFDDGIMLDYDDLGFDDMEFEPQTYFSFHELLASDNNGRAVGNDTPEDVNSA